MFGLTPIAATLVSAAFAALSKRPAVVVALALAASTAQAKMAYDPQCNPAHNRENFNIICTCCLQHDGWIRIYMGQRRPWFHNRDWRVIRQCVLDNGGHIYGDGAKGYD
jgi:hypothetical protein